ncbi:MAG: hypothetical protein EPN30_04725 [Actinomycetota bacterium]|nr:MAG: hypothetical protein EPN30_04725 [Actinomycetota bacterium]
MEHQKYVTYLDNIRHDLHFLMQEAPSPAIERLLQDADLQFHTALWLLGEVRGLTPEGEGHPVLEPVLEQA